MILDSSMVEHSAVNRVVVGSSPTRGVKKSPRTLMSAGFFLLHPKEVFYLKVKINREIRKYSRVIKLLPKRSE